MEEPTLYAVFDAFCMPAPNFDPATLGRRVDVRDEILLLSALRGIAIQSEVASARLLIEANAIRLRFEAPPRPLAGVVPIDGRGRDGV